MYILKTPEINRGICTIIGRIMYVLRGYNKIYVTIGVENISRYHILNASLFLLIMNTEVKFILLLRYIYMKTLGCVH